jgi:hypothetical protein
VSWIPLTFFLFGGGEGDILSGSHQGGMKGRERDVYSSFSPVKIIEATGKNKHLTKKDITNISIRWSTPPHADVL